MKLFTLILILFSFPVFPQDQNIKQVKLFINSKYDLQTAVSHSVNLEHYLSDKDGGIILYVNEDEFKSIVESGLRYDVLIDDWLSYYNYFPKLTEAEKEIVKSDSKQKYNVSGFDFGSMGGYYTYDEISSNLDSMYAQYPNLITQKFSIGTTWEGRDIWAVRISDNPNISEDEPTVGFDALVHAREPQSMATLMYFMWYLLENYGTDPQVTYLVDNREIYCVPCFNADGYEYNHQTNPNGGGMWRKNRRNSGGGDYGVDLNRNFSYKWGYDNIGSSGTPSSETYRGPSAFSEPESQAIRDFAILNHYGTHFNMHTYGDDILYPWGYIDAETPDSLTYREFAADLSIYNGYAFGTGYQLLGYPSNGAIRDWMYGEQTEKNKIYSYTIEIGPSFWPSQSQIFPVAQQNIGTMMYQSFVAGEYVQLVKHNFDREYFLPNDIVSLTPEFRNKGLATAYNLTFELSSPSQYITINTANASMDSLEARNSAAITDDLSFTISGLAPVNVEIPIVITTRIDNNILSSDTTSITIGYPVFIFEDSTNDPNDLWTITATPSNPKWEATTSTYFSPPTSFTDSKTGNYTSNATVTMTLTNPINILSYTNPKLRFQTKFDIESNWDYGQVRVSTDNGSTWIPLEGQYTEPGEGSFQPNGEPVYDGVISDWVKEEINLNDYLSSQFKIQFRLRTDGGVTRDGWYLDDIGVFIYTVPVGLETESKTIYSFSLEQNYPNPFNPVTKIKYSIPSSGKSSKEFVQLKVYDILGSEVATLVNEGKSAGNYEVDFDADKLSSGVYYYQLKAGNFVSTKKMILLR